MDAIFTRLSCDRCGQSPAKGRQMSMFNTDCLCLAYIEVEHQHGYQQVREADSAEIRRSNQNF